MRVKKICATFLSIGVLAGAIGSCPSISQAEMKDMGELTDAGTKLTAAQWSKYSEFDGWKHNLYVSGKYAGFVSNDGKSFWINGIKVEANEKEIHVPEKVEGKVVTKVGAFSLNAEKPNLFNNYPLEAGEKAQAFDDNITSVKLPDSVSEIGVNAFSNCKNLAQVSIPQKLERIGEKAFGNSDKVTSLSLPASTKIISKNAFEEADGFKSVTFNKNNKTFSSRKNAIYSKNGKDLYFILGKESGSFTIDKKVKRIVDVDNKKKINFLGELVGDRNVKVSKKNKVFGCKKQNIYLKKTGEMLYYAGLKGDYKLPNVIKKITKKTSWRSGVNTLRLNKNIKKVDCKYLPFGSVVSGSYLEDIYVAKYSKVKFQNIKELEAGYTVKIHVPKKSIAKAKKDFKKVSNVKVVASSK